MRVYTRVNTETPSPTLTKPLLRARKSLGDGHALPRSGAVTSRMRLLAVLCDPKTAKSGSMVADIL